jgi:hypothetical protein
VRRVLFDENLPRLLKRELPGFEVRTVVEIGWAGIKNGKLLRLAEAEFEVFVTADQTDFSGQAGGTPALPGKEKPRET